MKTIRALSLALLGSAVLGLTFGQPAQGQSRPAVSQTVDPIQAIKQQYATINKSAASYTTVKKELSGYSAEGGTLIAYFDGPKIMKMVVNHYGEGGRAIEEYYYSDNRLIFVFRKDSGYDTPMSGKVVYTGENRFYFNKNRLIRWINEDARQVAPGSREYLAKEKEYLQLSREFTDGARSRKSTIETR
jgi:hypothetical protein